MSRPAAVLLNCSSRSQKAAEQRARLTDILIASKLEAELICAERGAELAEIAQRIANDDRHGLIIAAGGDGSVNAVAAAVAGTTKTMAVLPLGTVNHFAKTLGMPMDLPSAVESLVDAETTLIDLGEINGIPFVNNSTLGVYPRIVRFREQLRARYGLNKWFAFAYATARMLPRRDPLRLKIVVDNKEELNVETTFVFIGKSDSTLGSLDLIPGGKPDPGKLSVCFVRSGSRLSMLRLGARAMAGRLPGAEGFEAFQAAELVITTEPDRLHVAMDGEVITPSTPLHYRVREAALRVAIPRRAREGECAPDQETREAQSRGEEPPCEPSSTFPTSTSAASTNSC